MYPRHRLDISERVMLRAMSTTLKTSATEAGAWASHVESRYSTDAIVILSVRSAFDLLLEACDVTAGDDIIMSSVTIADMGHIASSRGLRVVPIDLDPGTLAPCVESMRAAITPRTRMIVVAHLFGGRIDMTPYVELARAHDLLIVEDCAQALRGADDCGCEAADVSLFSFGPLKTATALGGAIAHVRRPQLAGRMRALHGQWPAHSESWYRRRVAKYSMFPPLLAPRAYRMVVRALTMRGRDIDTALNSFTRGFGHDPDRMLVGVRHRPPASLLRVLNDRLDRFPAQRLERRAEVGAWLAERLPPTVSLVGADQQSHTHWMMPIHTDSPGALVEHVRAAGFDATRASHTNMVALHPSADAEPSMHRMPGVLAYTVFIPAFPEIKPRDRERLIRALWHAPVADSQTPQELRPSTGVAISSSVR